jgi:transmembrane sensor
MNMERQDANRGTAPDSHGEAEQWFARLLDPACLPEQRAAFERWRNANAAHAAAYREVERLWQYSLAASRHPAVAAAAWRALRPEPVAHSPRRWLFPAAAVAAVAVVVASVVLPRWSTHAPAATGVTYTTAAGQQQTVRLADGSSIVLDTDTAVMVSYSASTRRVDLLRGQAQFSVQGNHAWPFVVHALHGTVTAVGTQFQVRINDDCTDVALIKGKLAIATMPANGTPHDAALVGGQGLAYDERGRISAARPLDAQDVQGWTEGKLFVHDWRLADLVEEMNRYSTTRLEIGDPGLRDIRISGVFHTHDQPSFLALLQQGWAVRATRVDAQRITLTQQR